MPNRRTLLICLAAMCLGYLLSNASLRWFGRAGAPAEREFETMATYARISVPAGSGITGSAADAAAAAERAVVEVNDLMSPFGDASDIRRLNAAKAGEWVEVRPATWTVVTEALRWHRLSGGAFDPTIAPLKSLFTFDRREAAEFPDEAAIAEARARVGAEKLLFDREGMRLSWTADGMRLDLGAIAKGFGADRAAEALLSAGAASALIDIGGELRLIGGKPGKEGESPSPWRAGIRNPRGADIVERLDLENAAVATSGDYENFFTYKGTRYEHIIDPRTGLPLTDAVASVTVIHPDSCLAADALATTMTVLGVDAGKAFLEENALGLFAKGVRVVMLQPLENDALRRVEFVVDQSGNVTMNDSTTGGAE